MQSNAWLVMAVICSWFTAIQCACARSEAGICASDLPVRFLSSESGRMTPERLYSDVVHCPQCSLLNSHAVGLKSLSLLKVAELSPDDEGQADDSQSDDKDMEFAFLKSCPPAADWRLSRPDKLRANSIINSKTQPPP